MADLELRKVQKRFGTVEVIKGIDLAISKGEFVVFVGPSGCGKSTLLRMIAGLEEISGGNVFLGGERVNETPAAGRGLAMVFQSYALYPHMSVRKNLAFGLETMKVAPEKIAAKVKEASEILQITELLERKPGQLSGGQRQRVAIGRAIVREPRIFLFDEPLSNLDAELRAQMRIEIKRLHQRLGSTMIFVTHDQVEAMTLADRIVVLRKGVVEQVGTPLELYNTPANMFVAGFIGSPRMNFMPAKMTKPGQVELPGGGKLRVAGSAQGVATLGVRPEDLMQVPAAKAVLKGKIQIIEQLGGETYVHAQIADQHPITVEIRGQAQLKPGEDIHLGFTDERFHLFDAQEKVVGKAG